jgi:hypothetical protein
VDGKEGRRCAHDVGVRREVKLMKEGTGEDAQAIKNWVEQEESETNSNAAAAL